MARARNIKPGFFTNDQLAEVSALGRLLFIGLWCIADRAGRLEDRPKKIRAEVLPYDECDPDALLDALHQKNFIIRYVVDEVAYIQIVAFTKHQDPHYKEKPSVIPPPDGFTDSGTTAGGVDEAVRQKVFDRDGRACKACGSVYDLSLDHVIPRSKGGTHDESNLQTLCRRCNSAKNNRRSSADHRSMIGQSSVQHSTDKPPLIPDSGFLIPDTRETTMSGKPDVVALKVDRTNSERREQAREVLGFLNSKTGRNYRFVDANLGPIMARMTEGATRRELRAVIARKCREWGSDEKMMQYLRPATLFNATKFNQYVGEVPPAEMEATQ